MGVYDDDNILSTLRGMRFIVKAIWEFALDFNKHYWIKYISDKETSVSPLGGFWDCIQFPKPKDLNINMMPFIMCKSFKDSKLPNYVKSYFAMIVQCLDEDSTQLNKIGYLTIHESYVEKGYTQRRPGLHVECPGNICIDTNDIKQYIKGAGECEQIYHPPYNTSAPSWHPWGQGHYEDKPVNGIYMATSMNDSCAIWDCKIIRNNDRDIIGHLGDIEHLRSIVSKYEKSVMEADRLYWLTDRTPHEALIIMQSGYRQFFRLVTHNVSVWYEQHSTKNPNGVEPNKNITTVVKKKK
eukprot:171222_1